MIDLPDKVLVRIYFDGLNFYYGIARAYQFKWIDIKSLLLELIRQIIPNAEIEMIYLYTAIVSGDEDAQARQHAYLGALGEAYGDSLVVVKGHMMSVEKTGKCFNKATGREEYRTIRTFEEKQTDVNLACQMVKDAYTVAGDEFDVACLVSNDSDFAFPLITKKELKQRTLLISPRTLSSKVPLAQSFKKHVYKKDRIYSIPRNVLVRHRLPDPVGRWRCPDARGW